MTRVPGVVARSVTAVTAMAAVAALGAGLLLGGACQKRDAVDTVTATESGGPGGGRGVKPKAGTQSNNELQTPLATIDDVTITLGELQDRINRQSPYIRARYTSLEQKREFLDAMVRFEVLAKEAYRRGLDRDPEVVRTMKQVMIQKLMRDELDAKITADTVSDAEMKTYYDANVADYVKPEEVRASAIIVKNKAQADRVALEARGEAGTTNKGFRDLVTKYSQDEETKLRGGDLRYMSRTAPDARIAPTVVPEAVVVAALAMPNIGDVSAAIDAGNGTYYVLKETGRHHSMTKAFEDAKAQIRNKLFRDKRLQAQKDFVDAARAKSQVTVDEANLAKVRIDTSKAVDVGQPSDLMPPAPGPLDPQMNPAPPPMPVAPMPVAPSPAPGNP